MENNTEQLESQETIPDKQEVKRDEKGRFIPGTCGNPDGRPPQVSVVLALKRKLLEVRDKTSKEQKTYLEELISAIMEKGIENKDVAMIRDIIDRVDGKPTQKSDITTGGKELNAVLVKFIDGESKDNNDTD